MSKKLNVISYRKLIDLELEFSPGINVISGTNGTCKSSILYLLSNSYQEVKGNISLKNCMTVIGSINNMMNPKIESLSKGDKQYNDPSNGVTGIILKVTYFDESTLEFRKHNSKKNARYAIKPYYVVNKGESLPKLPVIYLGLSRLISFGEYHEFDIDNVLGKVTALESVDEVTLKKIRGILQRELKNNYISVINKNLPSKYIDIINQEYENFTNVRVNHESFNKVGNIKKRAEFKTATPGIDSNTISAGEDNLYVIITALISLRYYYEESQKDVSYLYQRVKSLLLIDELDASLHPSYQIKLYELIKEYSENYNIQVVFTTHSLTLIDYSLKKKANVMYLLNEGNKVSVCNDIDMFSINMYLQQMTANQLQENSKIPIFTEDQEARDLLNIIFMKISDLDPNFKKVEGNFHFVSSNIGSNNLKSIFCDEILSGNIMKAICILDGDTNKDIEQNIITLPGKDNPESIIFNHLTKLLSENNEFWRHGQVHVNMGYTYDMAQSIYKEIVKIKEDIEQKKTNSKSVKGIEREKNKKIYNNYKDFFHIVFQAWLNDPSTQGEIQSFYNNLFLVFNKTRVAYNIPAKNWSDKADLFKSKEQVNNR
ncbi:DNA replication and repair protein RecF [compost metagenome]